MPTAGRIPTRGIRFRPLKAYLDFTDGQKEKHLFWWLINLVVHANLVLFIPPLLIFYCGAPVMVLAVTVLAFFANVVVNMGGACIRVTLSTFIGSLLINLSMVALYVL